MENKNEKQKKDEEGHRYKNKNEERAEVEDDCYVLVRIEGCGLHPARIVKNFPPTRPNYIVVQYTSGLQYDEVLLSSIEKL